MFRFIHHDGSSGTGETAQGALEAALTDGGADLLVEDVWGALAPQWRPANSGTARRRADLISARDGAWLGALEELEDLAG